MSGKLLLGIFKLRFGKLFHIPINIFYILNQLKEEI